MTGEVERAQRAANAPEHVAERDRNQRRGVDDDRPARNSEADPATPQDPAATQHPVGTDQAQENAENEPPG
jgi:hypothetical protein